MRENNTVRSILSELEPMLTNTVLDTSIFNPSLRKSQIRITLDNINCVEVIQRGTRGVSNKFIRKGKPTSNDQSICKDCSRIEVGCPIYERAINPNSFKTNDPSI